VSESCCEENLLVSKVRDARIAGHVYHAVERKSRVCLRCVMCEFCLCVRHRAEDNRAEDNRAEDNRAEENCAEENGAEENGAEDICAEDICAWHDRVCSGEHLVD
jgi:hypothetical protein